MIPKKAYELFSLIKLNLLPLVIILFALMMLFFSLKIDTTFAPNLYLYWFVIISQCTYVILLLIYMVKLYYRFITNFTKKEALHKFHADEEMLIENNFQSHNKFLRHSFLNLESNCDSGDNTVNNNLKYESVYEHIPLPLIITNNEGIVLGQNFLAKEFFNENLTNQNISKYIDFININNIKNCNVINIKLRIEKNNDFITSIFQKSIFDEKEKLKLVILVFLPGYINTIQRLEDLTEINETNEKYEDYIHKTPSIEDILNNLNIGILILNKDYQIMFLNSNAIELLNIIKEHNKWENLESNQNKNTKFHKESLIGKNFKDAFKGILDYKTILNIINSNKGVNKLEFSDLLYIEIQHTLINEDVIINLLNISERRKLELQNSFSQRLQTIGQIASAVAHDFNNLLTAIMSFTYFLKERYSEEDPSSLELEQIEQNANRAKVMIRQLLTFSRSKELNPIEFLVNSEISNLMSTILRLMGERIKTEFVRGKNIGKIIMDPVQFQQVIINLVVNARDAMKSGGKLIISTNLVKLKLPQEAVMATIPPGDYIVVSIKDQGEGIKKENFKKIFQTHFSTKGDKGNGLGLSTVAKIMQENSGFISLESVLNQGTSFHLYFSVDKANAHKEVDEKEVLVLKNNSVQDITLDLTGSGTILLVEDEIPVRTVCKRALVNKGYKVIEAEDAETALTLLQNLTNKVDLIISDVMMPGISGLEFISEAKKIKPNLKAILMSGYAEDTLEDNDYTLDSIEFLAKPFSPDVLATKVKKVINS